MNATEKGHEIGFVVWMSYQSISQQAFSQLGAWHARKVYKRPQKQAEFLLGWEEVVWLVNSNATNNIATGDSDILTY